MHSHFLKKFFKETLHFCRCWLFLKKWNNESVVMLLPHIILSSQNFQIKSSYCNKRGKRNHLKLLSYLVRNNMESYYPWTWMSFVNQKNEKTRNWSLLMKIISTVPKIIFQNNWSVYCIPILWIFRQLKHQLNKNWRTEVKDKNG